MAERLFLLCRDMETSEVSIAREVTSPLIFSTQVQVIRNGWKPLRDSFYVRFRKDREFPGYESLSGMSKGMLGDPWTLATEAEVVALRLTGQITRVECVETGE